MSDVVVRDQIRNFVLTNFLFGDASRMPEDSESLLETGIVDSTGVLELVDFLETDLGVPVTDYETVPNNFGTIANLTQFVARKQAPVVQE